MARKNDSTNQQATQHDLEIWGGRLGEQINELDENFDKLKHRFDGLEQRFDGLEKQIYQFKDEMIHEFKALAENIHQDVAGANADKISLLQNKTDDHEVRITVLEQR